MVWNWIKRKILEPVFGSRTGRLTPLTNQIAQDITGGNTTGNFGRDFMNIAKNATVGGGILKAGDHMGKAINSTVDFLQKSSGKVPVIGGLLSTGVGEVGKLLSTGANISTTIPRILEAGGVSASASNVIKKGLAI